MIRWDAAAFFLWWYSQPEIDIASAESASARLQAELPQIQARAETAEAERDRLQRLRKWGAHIEMGEYSPTAIAPRSYR